MRSPVRLLACSAGKTYGQGLLGMAETEAPPAPPVDAEAPRRKFPWVRALLGLALAAAAAFFVIVRPGPQELVLSGSLEPERPAPGTTARLLLKLKPGPDAPEGAVLCPGARVGLTAPEDRSIVFDRATECFLRPEEELAMYFKVSPLAAPGPRRLRIRVEAELGTGGARRLARLEREFTVTVAAPAPETEKDERAKAEKGGGGEGARRTTEQ
jgi:hypothetical protein